MLFAGWRVDLKSKQHMHFENLVDKHSLLSDVRNILHLSIHESYYDAADLPVPKAEHILWRR